MKVKKILTLCLVFIVLFMTGCSSTEKNNEETTVPIQSYTGLTDEQVDLLHRYIAVIPPFKNIKEVDDNFWHNFIFNLYTHSSSSDGLTITDKNEKTWIVVERDVISGITKQLFGIDLPTYIPHEENLYKEGTAYYILLTDNSNNQEIFSKYKFVRSTNEEVSFKNVDNSKYYFFTVEKNNTELGFVITSIVTTDKSPALTFEENTTIKEIEETEEYSFFFPVLN